MRRIQWITTILAILCAVAWVSCGDDDDDDDGGGGNSSIVGKWEVMQIVTTIKKVDGTFETFNFGESTGIRMFYTFGADKTFTVTGESTFDIPEDVLIEIKGTYELSGDKLRLTIDNEGEATDSRSWIN